jgi:predicted RNA-binding protein (virulence factor B family)
MHIQAGKTQELTVLEVTSDGAWLGSERDKALLSRKEAGRLQPGETVKVFVYYNEKKELEATTRVPLLELDQIGSFRILNVNDLGAFIDIGIRRDILIPRREMRAPIEEGRMALVILKDDPQNQRLFASTRIVSHLRNINLPYKRGEEVDLTIAERLEIGSRVVVNGLHHGIMFRTEMLRSVREGEKMKGYIRKIENDEITVSMQKEGIELIDDAVSRLMEFLENNNGYLRLSDDSDPEEIKMRLRMSKKTFKKAVGVLYKMEKIALTRFGIKIVDRSVLEENKNKPKPKRKRLDD